MVRLLQERRFPLQLLPTVDGIWDLYGQAKRGKWDPNRSIPWGDFKPAAYAPPVREAARLVWSRRVWSLYGRLAENPALLVRFCMEYQREADPKYFLSVKATEESWHIDCCHRFAGQLGGFVAQPANAAFGAAFNRALHARALDADVSLDAYVAAWATLVDAIRLGIEQAALDATRDPVAAAILGHMVQDKTRHVAFGWLYLETRAPGWDAAARAEIGRMAGEALGRVLLDGTEVAALAPAGTADDLIDAERQTNEAGLGAAGEDAAMAALRATLADARSRFRSLGLELATVPHPRIGAI